MFKYTTEGSLDGCHPYGGGYHKSGLGENIGGTALVILLILIVIALFWGFRSYERKSDEREMRTDERRLADNLYSMNGRLGIVEKGIVDNEKETSRNGAILNGLTQDYSFRIGGLTCQTNSNTNAINQLGHYTCNPSAVPFGFNAAAVAGGCRNANSAEFLKTATFEQSGTPTIVQREACGCAFE